MPKRETGKGKRTEDGGETRPMTIYLPLEVRKELLMRRVDEDRPASEIVADALRAYFKEHKRSS